MKILGGKISSSDIEKAYLLMDADNDGKIEFKEFSKRLRKYFS